MPMVGIIVGSTSDQPVMEDTLKTLTALGVEAVSQVPAHSRGSALGVYSVFMDVALALTGPLGGWLASDGRGFAPVYAASGVIALAAASRLTYSTGYLMSRSVSSATLK